MRYVKYASMASGVLALILSLVAGLQSAGGHGITVIALSLVPVALGAVFFRTGNPRWASIVGLVAFLVVAMKTSEGEALQNIMMAAALGMILCLALAVMPDRAKAT